MVPYAGRDPYENQIGTAPKRRTKSLIAYEYFLMGWGTDRIADRLNITEPKALKFISVERSHLLGLPDPYGGTA